MPLLSYTTSLNHQRYVLSSYHPCLIPLVRSSRILTGLSDHWLNGHWGNNWSSLPSWDCHPHFTRPALGQPCLAQHLIVSFMSPTPTTLAHSSYCISIPTPELVLVLTLAPSPTLTRNHTRFARVRARARECADPRPLSKKPNPGSGNSNDKPTHQPSSC